MQLQTNKNKNRFGFRSVKLISAICFVYIIFSPVLLFAKTLPEYRKNIREARDLTFVLLYPDEENTTLENSPKFERDILTKIRKSVPVNEKIEWQGASIETNNQWLFDALGRIEKEPADSPKRKAILTEISERLDALEQKFEELESFSAANRTKDEDKQKLAEILRREEYQKPEKPEESLFQKLYRKIVEWLASFFPRPNLSTPSTSGFQSISFVLQMILYALVFGVIAFLIYRFAPLLADRFRGREKQTKEERVILGEKLLPDQSSKDLFDEAEKLARDGNLRGAIRKGYIALLCELSDRKIIGLSVHKTNRDYLRDVRGKSELYKNMNGLTLNFERHWYGFESVEEKDWEEFRNGYRRAVGSGSRQSAVGSRQSAVGSSRRQ